MAGCSDFLVYFSSQTKDYKMNVCYFSAKHTSLRSKSKDWLARNQNGVSEWCYMSTRGLLFQFLVRTIKNPIKTVSLGLGGHHHYLIVMKHAFDMI